MTIHWHLNRMAFHRKAISILKRIVKRDPEFALPKIKNHKAQFWKEWKQLRKISSLIQF